MIQYRMTSIWVGKRVRLCGIEPDDATVFMGFAVDEEGLGDLVSRPRSAEGYRIWAKLPAGSRSGRHRGNGGGRRLPPG